MAKKLNAKELKELETSLYFLNVEELKEVCEQFDLSASGKKGEIVQRVLSFAKTGESIPSPSFPESAKAKKGMFYPLEKKTLILKGSYKNDLKTRQFLKNLVGEHFHFTAFGQDWIRKRWLLGDPPTYQEFAAYWEKEHEARKKKQAAPKQEWAYLSFIQRHLVKNPKASREEITSAWEKERLLQVKKAKLILRKLSRTF